MDRLVMLAVVAVAALVEPVCAHADEPWQSSITEAAQRFNLPESWIRSLIKTESNGDVQAISPKGAMGLMQLMPDTWAEMRAAYTLGEDPFESRANILAGTAYLRALYEQFGYPALFAAYNAGPGRYQTFLHTGKPLPEETRRYVARIEQHLFSPVNEAHADRSGTGLFFPLSHTQNPMRETNNPASSHGLFVPVSGQARGQHD